jgi:hypothetical protein
VIIQNRSRGLMQEQLKLLCVHDAGCGLKRRTQKRLPGRAVPGGIAQENSGNICGSMQPQCFACRSGAEICICKQGVRLHPSKALGVDEISNGFIIRMFKYQ